MFRHLLSFLAVMGLAACQQDQTTLKFGPATVFQDKYGDEVFQLTHDDGSDVELRAVRPSVASGARGSVGNDHDIFNYAGCGIYGCNNDPWSYWVGYGNYTHSWNPYITRNVTIQFRQQLVTTLQYPSPGTEGCWNITLSSSHRIVALRGRSAHAMAPLRVNGNYSTQVQVQIGSNNNWPGTLTLGLQEDPYQGCGTTPDWWNFPNHYIWPGCGGNRTQSTLRMTGTVTQCGASGPATSVAAHSVNLDLTPYLNTHLNGYYYQMPYFALAATQDQSFYITGRVLDYGNNYHFWGAP